MQGGGTRATPVDVRILAATNRNLEQMVSEGSSERIYIIV